MEEVKIITNDGRIISLEKDTFIYISTYIGLFQGMIEDIDYENIGKEDIPLNGAEASYDTVSTIIEFLCTIRQIPKQNIESVEDEFIKNFSTKLIFQLILTANFIECKYVLDLLCKSIAKKIKE